MEEKLTTMEYGLYKLEDIDLIDAVAEYARQEYDGHFTIMSFATGYKVIFGTPDLSYQSEAYEKLFNLTIYKTLKEALVYAIMYQAEI